MITPASVGITKYSSWREGQLEAIMNILNSPNKFHILDAPTGSGKSGIAVGLSGGMGVEKVRIITSTISLQSQYIDESTLARTVYGMTHYPCDLSIFGQLTAKECVHANNMSACSMADICQYLVARGKTQKASVQVLSYAYFLSALWPKSDTENTILFIDEAHSLPPYLMGAGELVVTDEMCSKYRMPKLPQELKSSALNRMGIIQWLNTGLEALREYYKILQKSEGHSSSAALRDKLQRIKDLGQKMGLAQNALKNFPDTYFVAQTREELHLKPLTPHKLAPMLLDYDLFDKVVFASATIGNPKVFARLMGLEKYNVVKVKPRFTPEENPIRVYKNAPKMSWKNRTSGLRKQSVLINELIEETRRLDKDGHVLVHTASKNDAYALRDLISNQYRRQVFIPPDSGSTEDKILAWEKFKKNTPGSICFSWCFHTGVDAPDVFTNIVQKVPFISLSDDWGKQFLKFDPKHYSWAAANQTEQGAGRNRRGYEEHYDMDGKIAKIVAIIDKNVDRVKGQASAYFRERLMEY